MMYPLTFNYVTKDYLWGGARLSKYNRPMNANGKIAESWEISAHPNGESIVQNGKFEGMTLAELCQRYPDDILGPNRLEDKFPFLIKFIDAADDLSVQVHPNNTQGAKLNPPSYGKNELWYIIDAPESAKLVAGVKDGTTADELRASAINGDMSSVLNYQSVKPSQLVNIPAGTVHAITSGLFVCEIQQNSDITYRLYDYDRVDKDGKKRELHLEQGIEVINFDASGKNVFDGFQVDLEDNSSHKVGILRYLVVNAYFIVEKWSIEKQFALKPCNSFRTLSVLSGRAEIKYLDDNNDEKHILIEKFNSVLLPYKCNSVEIIPLESDEKLEILTAKPSINSEHDKLRENLLSINSKVDELVAFEAKVIE